MATGLHIRSGITLDKFTNEFSSSYALSYDPTSGQIGYMGTGSFTAGYLTLDNTGSFATTGSNNFNGSQTITGSLTVTQNLNVLGTASFQYVTTVYETASVIYSSGSNQFGDATNDTQTLIGTVRVSGSLEVTASTITLNIPSKSSGYVLQSDSNGNATWVNPGLLNTAIQSYIGIGNVTASVSTGTGSFQIISGSSTFLSIISSGSTTASVGINCQPNPSYSLDINGTTRAIGTIYLQALNSSQASNTPNYNGYAFANTGSRNTGMFYFTPTVMIFDVAGQNVLKITNTKNVTNIPIEFGTVTNAGNITYASQTLGGLVLNAGSASGSIYTPSGSVVIGKIGFTTGSKLNVEGDTYISGTLATSGSVVFRTISNTSAANYLSYDSSTGQVYYSPTSSISVSSTPFPYSGSAVITGSLLVSGSGGLNVTGSLGINGSLTENIVTSSLGAGTTTIFQRNTGSFTSALAKYTVNKSTNARAGEFMTVWNGNQIVNADISTTDIGSTSEVAFTSSLVNGQIQTNVVTTTSGWNVKMLITYL